MEYKLDDLKVSSLSKKLRIKGPTNVETVGWNTVDSWNGSKKDD